MRLASAVIMYFCRRPEKSCLRVVVCKPRNIPVVMSDERIYSIPIAVWSSCVAFQLAEVVREWWTNRGVRRRKRYVFVYERGFRLWMQPQCCPYSRWVCHYNVVRPLPTGSDDDGWKEWIEKEPMSLVMVVQHRDPFATDGEQARVMVRRYSILTPSIYTDVVELIYRRDPVEIGWEMQYGLQPDDRTVILAFKHRVLDRYCVVLIDVQQRSNRLVIITSPPIESRSIHHVHLFGKSEKSRLRIIYGIEKPNTQGLISVDYEISPSIIDPSHSFATEVASQSITIPGRRYFDRLLKENKIRVPGSLFLIAREPGVSSWAITFDRLGNFRIKPFDEWVRDFRATDYGRRLFNAAEDFKATTPTGIPCYVHVVPFYNHVLTVTGDEFALRHLYPPSWKLRAAEAVCRAKPNVDPSVIKAEIGFDVFDGIEEDRKKSVSTVRLPTYEADLDADMHTAEEPPFDDQ